MHSAHDITMSVTTVTAVKLTRCLESFVRQVVHQQASHGRDRQILQTHVSVLFTDLCPLAQRKAQDQC